MSRWSKRRQVSDSRRRCLQYLVGRRRRDCVVKSMVKSEADTPLRRHRAGGVTRLTQAVNKGSNRSEAVIVWLDVGLQDCEYTLTSNYDISPPRC